MKISVIGLGMYSLAISKMLAKKENNKIMIWTENNAKYEEYKKLKKLHQYMILKYLEILKFQIH